VIGKISIRGHIGPSYVDEKGIFHKGVVLLDVIDQVMSQSLATSFEVDVDSPGGFVDIGNDIYNYLVDLDKTRPVTTLQKGLVGSIATKIFLAGSTRLVDDRYEFWIHNPFKEKVTGDADQLRAEADATEKTEKDIRKFYGSFTPMGDVAIDALMKQETGLTADQCIKYGFATGKVSAPVFNIINKKDMSTTPKKDENVLDQIKALLGLKPEEKKKGVQPKAKAELPGASAASAEAPKNTVINLADGAGSFWIESDELAVGVAGFLLDEAGQPTVEPLADGVYPIDGGAIATFVGGKVSEFMPATEDPEEEDPIEVDAKIEAALAKQKEELTKEFDSKLLALKKGVSIGKQPTKGVITAKKEEKEKPKGLTAAIHAKMKDKAEERKNQLNGKKTK